MRGLAGIDTGVPDITEFNDATDAMDGVDTIPVYTGDVPILPGKLTPGVDMNIAGVDIPLPGWDVSPCRRGLICFWDAWSTRLALLDLALD